MSITPLPTRQPKAKQKHQPTRAAIERVHAKSASATKRGPGRFAEAGAAGNRLTKPRKVRAYAALLAAWAAKRITKTKLRDEHGAYTLVGKAFEVDGIHPTPREHVSSGWVDGDDFGYTLQRKWLAGVSAQRGY